MLIWFSRLVKLHPAVEITFLIPEPIAERGAKEIERHFSEDEQHLRDLVRYESCCILLLPRIHDIKGLTSFQAQVLFARTSCERVLMTVTTLYSLIQRVETRMCSFAMYGSVNAYRSLPTT